MLPSGGTDALEASYRNLLELCDLLEGIADALPAADRSLCIEVADTIELRVEATHSLEESVLFPILAASGRPEVDRTVERLRQEHVADSCTAGEVGDALRELAAGRSTLSPDAVGYLLRSVFDSMRRHVHGELDLMHQILPPADRKDIH